MNYKELLKKLLKQSELEDYKHLSEMRDRFNSSTVYDNPSVKTLCIADVLKHLGRTPLKEDLEQRIEKSLEEDVRWREDMHRCKEAHPHTYTGTYDESVTTTTLKYILQELELNDESTLTPI